MYPFPYDHHELDISIGVSYGAFSQVPIKPAVEQDNMRASGAGEQPFGIITEHVKLQEFQVVRQLRMRPNSKHGLLVSIGIWRK